jgi:hypothetical protein
VIVIGGLDQRDGEIRGEDTSWNLGEAAARGRDGKGQGCFSGVLVLEGRFRASALSKWTPLCIRFFIGKAKTPAIARSHTD